MKTLFLTAAALALFCAGSLQAAAAPKPAKPAPKAEVVFDHPDKFTDVKDDYFPTDRGRDGILEQIRSCIVAQAEYLVPDGYRLTMTFTDIDLAGDFEPWRGAQWASVRIVKAIYPPAFKFSWAVIDPSGKVVREGKEDMRVLEFEMTMTLDLQDPLRYEKAILEGWMRDNLRDLKKAAGAGVPAGKPAGFVDKL